MGRPEGTYTQAERVLRLVDQLRTPRTLEELAVEFGVTDRTVRRDLAVIRAVYDVRRAGDCYALGEVHRG